MSDDHSTEIATRVNSAVRLVMRDTWPCPGMEITFSEREQSRLEGVGIVCPTFKVKHGSFHQVIFEGESIELEDVVAWVFPNPSTRRQEPMETLRTVRIFKGSKKGVLLVYVRAEILNTRRENGTPFVDAFELQLPYYDIRSAAIAQIGAIQASLALQADEQTQRPWKAPFLCEVLDILRKADGSSQENQLHAEAVATLINVMAMTSVIDDDAAREGYLLSVIEDGLGGYLTDLKDAQAHRDSPEFRGWAEYKRRQHQEVQEVGEVICKVAGCDTLLSQESAADGDIVSEAAGKNQPDLHESGMRETMDQGMLSPPTTIQ